MKQKLDRTWIGWLGRVLTRGLIILLVLGIFLAVVPATFPGFGAKMADLLRAVFGPQPVAALESISFTIKDKLNQFRSDLNGGQVQISLAGEEQKLPEAATPLITVTPPSQNNLSSEIQATPQPSRNVVTDDPDLGWQAYGPLVEGNPVMAQVIIKPDAERLYAAIVLVRIDLSKLQLHMMPGNLEPPHSSEIAQTFPDLGMIPVAEQGRLIAAFNGGFKSVHGHYGMMVNDVTLLSPLAGVATVAVYREGHVEIGTWGKEINSTEDMLAFRQNCPPLIESGEINPDVFTINKKDWGYTNNLDITWRTGIGITRDKRYLIYAVGNAASAATLARALFDAGAYHAMQLDINQFYAHFNTYQPSDPSTSKGFNLGGERLVKEMINNPHLYLTPNERDFFYLTVR